MPIRSNRRVGKIQLIRAMKQLVSIITIILLSVIVKAQKPMQDENGQYYEPFRSNMQIQKDLAVFGNRVSFVDPTVSVAIGDTAGEVASSILTIESTDKGVVLPRMTTTQRNNIVSPATGLTIYNTTTSTFNFYDGSAWQTFGAGSGGYFARSGGSLYPNTITDSLGVGTSSITDLLDVNGTADIADDSTRLKVGSLGVNIGGSDLTFSGFTANRKSPNSWKYYLNINTVDELGLYRAEIAAIDTGTGDINGFQATSLEATLRAGNIGTNAYNQLFSNKNEGIRASLKSNDTSAFTIQDFNSNLAFEVLPKYSIVRINEPYTFIAPVLHQAVGGTTATTDWESLGSYTVQAGFLADASSLDIDLAMTGSNANDSLLVMFGADTVMLGEMGSGIGFSPSGNIFYASAGDVTLQSINSGELFLGTEDNTTDILIDVRAKSQTIGNQTLKFFRIKYHP